MFNRLLIIVASALLAACATGVPEPVRRPVTDDPGYAAVQADQTDRYRGRRVRWGGTLLKVENRKTDSLLEILAQPLNRSGRPAAVATGLGRFVVRVEGFVDPSAHPLQRQITVAGRLGGHLSRPIGDYPYRYPVVEAEAVHLWPPLPELRDPYVDPFWYDPWYPSWYPWGYPYYRYPYYR